MMKFLIVTKLWFLINIGELVIFSSNNVGIICYVIWGIYIQESMRTQNENI